ncbi:hypothetical protein [Halonatronum saccharophilum]|uniref:hypothetical protein n=1 Tax=Halonatronum saccharophilum TaxID=150060 RepID=UPI000487E8DC|nr:hypothetical protein [Halonatronum saccharophilum]
MGKDHSWAPFSEIDKLKGQLAKFNLDSEGMESTVKIKEGDNSLKVDMKLDSKDLEEAEVLLSEESILVKGKGDRIIKSIALPCEVNPDAKIEFSEARLKFEANYKR